MSIVSPSQDEIIKDLLLKVKERSFYKGALVKAVLVRTANGLQVSTVIATACNETKSARPPHKYGPLVLEESWYSRDDFLAWLSKLATMSTVDTPSAHEIVVKGSWQPISTLYETYIPSNYEYLDLDWPSNLYRYIITQGIVPPPGEIPTPSDLPLFPNGMEAAEWWLGGEDLWRTDLLGKVLVLLPNYVARIMELEIGEKQLSFSVQRNDKVKLLSKLFVKDQPTKSRLLRDQQIRTDRGAFEISSNWTYLKLSLVDEEKGEVLDYRTVYSGWTNIPKGVRFRPGSQDLLTMIRHGEREDVDFKEEVTKHDDIVKTIVAFANTRGGVLVFGVDDECQVVGVADDAAEVEGRIRNWMRDSCEQPIQLDFQSKTLLDRNLILVQVKQSPDRPCWFKDKGPFVRYGSNNRIATRPEVEQMLRKETPWAPSPAGSP